jgi:hypothetical protein
MCRCPPGNRVYLCIGAGAHDKTRAGQPRPALSNWQKAALLPLACVRSGYSLWLLVLAALLVNMMWYHCLANSQNLNLNRGLKLPIALAMHGSRVNAQTERPKLSELLFSVTDQSGVLEWVP